VATRAPSAIAGAVGAVVALPYTVLAVRYGLGTLDDPGAGFYPVVVGALLLLACIGTAVEAIARRPDTAVAWPSGIARVRMLALVAASVGYVVLLPYAGHPVAGTLVTLAALQVMGLRGWPLKLALALAVGLGSHYLFAVVLGVPLPRGAWSG